MSVLIEYNGKYPNLCRGKLLVTIGIKKWEFPDHCLSSGGCVWFDDEWQEYVCDGLWTVTDWPDGFPEDKMQAVTDAVNAAIPHGCCGGCI